MYKDTIQFKSIFNYSLLGMKETEELTILVGKIEQYGPEAWLHEIYYPLSSDEINILQNELMIDLPESLQLFYREMNGINIFNDAMSIHGYRRSNVLRLAWQFQPYSILTRNIYERPVNAKVNHLFIGSYSFDGSVLFIDLFDEKNIEVKEMM